MIEVRLEIPEATEQEATLTHWHVNPGQRVAKGQDLAELTTSKTVFVVQAPAAGIIFDIKAPKDAIVKAGEVLCTVETL